MNPDDFKKVLDDALEPIKKTQGEQTRKLNALWDQVVEVTEDLTEVKETLAAHTVSLAAHTVSLAAHTAALKRIETKDKNNSDDIEKVDKRLTEVESHIGIVPPPQLTIIR